MTPGWVLLQCLRWVVTFEEGPEIFRRVRTRVRTAVGPLFEMLHIYMVLARLCKTHTYPVWGMTMLRQIRSAVACIWLTQFVGCNNFEFRNNLSGVTAL